MQDSIRSESRGDIPLELPERHANFTDRVNELKQLLSELQPGKVVTLCGAGGIGKSALAAEAIWMLTSGKNTPEMFPHGVIWHDFYTRPKSETALEHIALTFGEEPVPTPFDAAQRALSGKTVLLLLDGTEDTDNLALITRITGNCGVIVTSRKRRDAKEKRQDIESLDPEEAVILLQKWAGNQISEASARRICELVGRLPLAVRIAGRYLSETGETAEEYLEFLEETTLEALDHGDRKLESVSLLLKRSLKQVGEHAENILAVAGILAFDSFSTEAVRTALPEIHIWKPLNELVGYGLLTRSEGRCMITHALIHTYARERLMFLPDNSVISRLAGYYTDFARKSSHSDIDPERMHIMKVMEACKKQKEWNAAISLVWSADDYLDNRGYLTEYLTALETGLEAARNSEDKDNESSFLLKMGICHHTQGRLNEAVADFANAIELMESLRKILEPRSEWPPQMTNGLATAYLNRGVAYKNQGRYEEAVADYANAIELMEALFIAGFPPVIPNLAMAFYNLLLLLRKEKPDEAGKTASGASAFLENLAGMTDINALPESWRRELDDLERLIKEQ